MPFMATETKNSTRGGWNRIRIDKKEAYERLMAVRDEFEVCLAFCWLLLVSSCLVALRCFMVTQMPFAECF